MTPEQALASLKAATADYSTAKKSLAYHTGLQKHGLANSLMHAVAAHHSAFYRLERAQAAYAALQPPPAPKPTVAPKPSVTTVKPAPAPTPVAPSFAEAKADADRAREAYQVAMRRQNEAHKRAVAAYQARPAVTLSQRNT